MVFIEKVSSRKEDNHRERGSGRNLDWSLWIDLNGVPTRLHSFSFETVSFRGIERSSPPLHWRESRSRWKLRAAPAFVTILTASIARPNGSRDDPTSSFLPRHLGDERVSNSFFYSGWSNTKTFGMGSWSSSLMNSLRTRNNFRTRGFRTFSPFAIRFFPPSINGGFAFLRIINLPANLAYLIWNNYRSSIRQMHNRVYKQFR